MSSLCPVIPLSTKAQFSKLLDYLYFFKNVEAQMKVNEIRERFDQHRM